MGYMLKENKGISICYGYGACRQCWTQVLTLLSGCHSIMCHLPWFPFATRVCSEYAIPLPGLPYPSRFPLVLKAHLKSLFPPQSLSTKPVCGNHFSPWFWIALLLKLEKQSSGSVISSFLLCISLLLWWGNCGSPWRFQGSHYTLNEADWWVGRAQDLYSYTPILSAQPLCLSSYFYGFEKMIFSKPSF